MRNCFILCFIGSLLIGCFGNADSNKAQEIVDKAIAAYGFQNLRNFRIAFSFRERSYTARRNEGLFTYTRSFRDSTGQVEDVLTNNAFYRRINGKLVNLPAERKLAFSQSVNSVIYFALLPFGLNDPAVRKKYIGETAIQGQPYHKIEVTFAQEGGGTDYDDVYLYWINAQTFTMDYLAYSFHTEEGGLRFRKSYGPQVIGGLRFQNYINYEPPTKEALLMDLDKLFAAGKLKEISRIELQNITVNTHK